MDHILFNRKLNALKDKHPSEVPLIEGLQDLFNREVEIISDRSRKALLQFPMQFSQRIQKGHGDWTTQLHIWASLQVPEILELDPLVLTTKDSDGNTVLMALLLSALGSLTQQINYDLLQNILDTNMNYVYLERAGDESSKVEGCAWNEPDLHGRTALDYLADFATGTGIFSDCEPDSRVQEMLAQFANEPEDSPAEDKTVDETFDETAAQDAIEAAEDARDETLSTSADDIPTADDIIETGKAENENAPDEQEQLTSDKNVENDSVDPIETGDDDGKKALLQALLTIGRNILK